MGETSDNLARVPVEPDEPEPVLDEPGHASGDRDRNAREDTELARVRLNYSRASSYRAQSSSTGFKKSSSFLERFTYSVSKFWRHQISIDVEHSACRDHLSIERTFLGYLRTSLAFSMIGIAVAQLFRLQNSTQPNPVFGFYVLGKPLSCICQGAAIYTLAIGAFRTWRSQNAVVRGKAVSGGFEIVFLAAGVFIILILFLVLLIAVDVDKK